MPRFLTALTVLWICAPLAAQVGSLPAQGTASPQRTTSQNDSPEPSAVIRGRVLAADSGQPLRRATVRLMPVQTGGTSGPGASGIGSSITDDDGRYEFKNLAAGSYRLSASKSPYIDLFYGQTRPFEPGAPLEILDHQTLEKVDFVLPRGSVVTGRIFDEFGEPLSEVSVSVQRGGAGSAQTIQVGGAMTDDIGAFRVYGLQPGQYYVLATWTPTSQNISNDRTGYAPTYYPGTTMLATAQRITVGIGESVGDITMPLAAMKTTRISGTAVDTEGRPMRGGVSAVPLNPTGPAGFVGSAIRPDGSFSVGGLTPGEYVLQAQEFGRQDGDIARATVNVSNEDVTGLRLVGGKPPVVRGRLIVDPSALSSLPSGLMVLLAPELGPRVFGAFRPGPVADDLTFELQGGAGRAQIELTGQRSGWLIRTVRYKGLDVTDSGLELEPNGTIDGVEVELTNRASTLSGSVTNTRSEPAGGSVIVVFPQDQTRWGKVSRYLRTGGSGQDGRFTIPAMPPGDYYIVAIERIDGFSITDDADFLARIRPDAAAFSIGEGETKIFDLKLVSSPRR
ncbi:MAG TPA: carboxypeptidase-like regulatory domain-containing protein [Vicinamibacterales bacterium]|nr:carboxypeptidase-like regulatory domain-containing protein [Vicinamibacterales bacterium]